MRDNLALFALLALTGVACGNDSTSSSSTDLCANSGAAATVTADGFAFTPASVTIAVGQSVCWQNTGNQTHTVTDNNGRFNGSLPAGQTFVYTFTFSSNSFGFFYHCQQHSTMTGTVIVNP